MQKDSFQDDDSWNDEPTGSQDRIQTPPAQHMSKTDSAEPLDDDNAVQIIQGDNLKEFSGKPGIKVVVSDPKKKGHIVSTSTFALTTQTNMFGPPGAAYMVRRKYEDFEWLCEVWGLDWIIIPPLPPNQVSEKVVRYLQSFMDRVCAHSILSKGDKLQLFLSGSAEELKRVKKEFAKGNKEKGKNEVPAGYWKGPEVTRDRDVQKAEDYLQGLEKRVRDMVVRIDSHIKTVQAATLPKPLAGIDDMVEGEPAGSYLQQVFGTFSKNIKTLETEVPARTIESEQLLRWRLNDLAGYLHSALVFIQEVHECEGRAHYWASMLERTREQLAARMQEKDSAEKLAVGITKPIDVGEGESVAAVVEKQKEEEKSKQKEFKKVQKGEKALVKAIADLEERIQALQEKVTGSATQLQECLVASKRELCEFEQRKDKEFQSCYGAYLEQAMALHQDRYHANSDTLQVINRSINMDNRSLNF